MWSLSNTVDEPLTPVTVEPDLIDNILSDHPLDSSPPIEEPNPIVSLDPITALQIVFQLRTSCVQLIPFKCRRVVADAYDRVIKAVNVSNLNLECHARLLCFIPYTMSRVTDRSKNQSVQIKSRARSFAATSLFDIVNSIMEDSLHLEHQKAATSIKLRNVKRLISLGRLSDAIKMLQSNGVHPINTMVIQSLIDKHPQMVPCPEHDFNWLKHNFTTEQVAVAIASFPAGSSGGPFGLVEKFLKDLVSDAQLGNILLESLAYFCSSFASGIFPLALAPYYGSARLIPLVKKDGGSDLWPLAKPFVD